MSKSSYVKPLAELWRKAVLISSICVWFLWVTTQTIDHPFKTSMGVSLESQGWPLIHTEKKERPPFNNAASVVFSPIRFVTNLGFLALVIVMICLRQNRNILAFRLSLSALFLLTTIIGIFAGDFALGNTLPDWIDGNSASRIHYKNQLYLFPYQPLCRFGTATHLIGIACGVAIFLFTQNRAKIK